MNKLFLIEKNINGRCVLTLLNKRTLSIIVYYTLAILALCSCAFFIYCLSVRGLVMWARVIYFIWSAAVAGVIVFDIFCTSSRQGKEITGFIVYILSLLAIGMAVILYFMNSGATGLAESFFNMFLSVSIISLMTTGYMIATWCVGEAVCEHQSAEISIEQKK